MHTIFLGANVFAAADSGQSVRYEARLGGAALGWHCYAMTSPLPGRSTDTGQVDPGDSLGTQRLN